jgi:predicted membrane channel-forming protein YqfA (hemolysin III family)
MWTLIVIADSTAASGSGFGCSPNNTYNTKFSLLYYVLYVSIVLCIVICIMHFRSLVASLAVVWSCVLSLLSCAVRWRVPVGCGARRAARWSASRLSSRVHPPLFALFV